MLTASQALPLAKTSSHTRIPSKLRESSVISSVIQDQRSNTPDSQVSSPAMSASTPSAFSIQSPVLAGAGIPGKPNLTRNGNSLGSASSMRFSPPPPPPPVIRGVDDYFIGTSTPLSLLLHVSRCFNVMFTQTSKATKLALLPIARATKPHHVSPLSRLSRFLWPLRDSRNLSSFM